MKIKRRICSNCGGTGFNLIYTEHEEYIEDCALCNGLGVVNDSKISNADKIRAMNNKELAEWLIYRNVSCSCCTFKEGCVKCDEDKEMYGVMQWLDDTVD